MSASANKSKELFEFLLSNLWGPPGPLAWKIVSSCMRYPDDPETEIGDMLVATIQEDTTDPNVYPRQVTFQVLSMGGPSLCGLHKAEINYRLSVLGYPDSEGSSVTQSVRKRPGITRQADFVIVSLSLEALIHRYAFLR